MIKTDNAGFPNYLNLRHCEPHPRPIRQSSQIMIHIFKDHVDASLVLVTLSCLKQFEITDPEDGLLMIASEDKSGCKQAIPGFPCSSFSGPGGVHTKSPYKTDSSDEKMEIKNIRKVPGEVTISFSWITFWWCSFFSILISRMAVIGNYKKRST